jgi:hypothetical protein
VRIISSKQQSVDIDRLMHLAQELKRMEVIVEEQIMGIYGSTRSLIQDVQQQYPEPYVQRAAREVEDLLQQIRKDGEVIHDKLHRMNRELTSTAGRYIADEQKLKQLINNQSMKFSLKDSFISLFSRFKEAITGNDSTLKSPIEMVKSLLTEVHEVSLELRLNKFKDDEMIGAYLEILNTGSPEKQQFAREQLTQINQALNQIARSQVAYDIYSKYGNQLYMEEVHIQAEQARVALTELGVAAKWYAADVSLKSQYIGSPLDACQYNPYKTDGSGVPTLDEPRLAILLGMKSEKYQAWAKEHYGEIESASLAAEKKRIEMAAKIEEYNKTVTTTSMISMISTMQGYLQVMNMYHGEDTGQYNAEFIASVEEYQRMSNARENRNIKFEINGKVDSNLLMLVYGDSAEYENATESAGRIKGGIGISMGAMKQAIEDVTGMSDLDEGTLGIPSISEMKALGTAIYKGELTFDEIKDALGEGIVEEFTVPFKDVKRLSGSVLNGDATFIEYELYGRSMVKVVELLLIAKTIAKSGTKLTSNLSDKLAKIVPETVDGIKKGINNPIGSSSIMGPSPSLPGFQGKYDFLDSGPSHDSKITPTQKEKQEFYRQQEALGKQENERILSQKTDEITPGKNQDLEKAEGTGNGADVTKGYDVTPNYSSYKERLDRTPKNNGTWEAERGESKFVSEKPEVKQYLNEAGVDGVEYKNAIPDFSPFTKGEVKIPNMTNDRRKNFANADETLANQWSTPEKKWTADDVADWRDDNNYTWHELNDLESMQLVPGKINGTFNHLGGVGEHNIKEKLGE